MEQPTSETPHAVRQSQVAPLHLPVTTGVAVSAHPCAVTVITQYNAALEQACHVRGKALMEAVYSCLDAPHKLTTDVSTLRRNTPTKHIVVSSPVTKGIAQRTASRSPGRVRSSAVM